METILNKESRAAIELMVADGIIAKDTAERYFPELKESEDEKLKEQVVYAINQLHVCECTKNKLISWLEKQGKPIDKIVKRAMNEKQRVLLTETNGDANIDWDTRSLQDVKLLLEYGLDYIKKLKKQSEQKPYASETMNEKGDFDNGFTRMLEKEQKPADKVEPKFKVGDWIITPENKVLQITSIEGTNYRFNNESHYWEICYCDEKCYLWTIQDAKDGDVLNSMRVQATIIFKGFADDGKHILAYCALQKGIFIKEEMLWDRDFNPSPKNWNGELFSKMKEAGYEWDAEKKELKKIENEIEIPFSAKDSELQEVTYYIPKGFYAEIKGNKVVIKKGEQNSAWSEDDIDIICKAIFDYDKIDMIKTMQLIDFVKSLKSRVQPQSTWKPSDEQMEALSKAIAFVSDSNSDVKHTLESLYSELKKL